MNQECRRAVVRTIMRAIRSAEADFPPAPHIGYAPYVLGWLLQEADVSLGDHMRIMSRIRGERPVQRLTAELDR